MSFLHGEAEAFKVEIQRENCSNVASNSSQEEKLSWFGHLFISLRHLSSEVDLIN